MRCIPARMPWDPVAANAGVRRLETTGTVQTIAAPAPIRFKAPRLEIPLPESSMPYPQTAQTSSRRSFLRPS